MKKILLSILTIASFATVGFGQTFYGVEKIEADDFSGISGLEVKFTDAEDSINGFKYNDFAKAPIVNEDDEYLLVTTNPIDSTYDASEWWKRGSLQYFKNNSDASAYLHFDLSSNGKASFTIQSDVPVGYNFKLDYTSWAKENIVLEFMDTIKTTGKKVTVEVDFAAKALEVQTADGINSKNFTNFYLWLYTTDSAAHEVKVYQISYGTKMIVNVKETQKTQSFTTTLQTAEKLEVLNLLGQVKQTAKSIDEIVVKDEIVIIRATMPDGTIITGKLGN